ncbi:MAG: S8 family serine peptidase [Dehalococcoidia bacterium]
MIKPVRGKRILITIALVFVSTMLYPVISPASVAENRIDPASKIEGLLALQVDMKLHGIQSETGAPSGPDADREQAIGAPENQRVFIYFDQEPSSSQLAELESLGVSIHPETWIPPLEKHPYGFLKADIPLTRLYDVAELESVVSMSSAEVVSYPDNDRAAAATNVDDVWDTLSYSGSGVTIAVLDSGFEVGNPDFPLMDCETNYLDYSGPGTDCDVANQCTGHGTHVAGTALGRGTSGSPTGIYQGAAYEATPVLLKIGNDTTGSTTSDVQVDAIKAAVDDFGADVITMSYGGWGPYNDGSDAVCQAIDYAVSRGVVYFNSAGNYANESYHYSGTVNANSETGWIEVNASGNPTLYYNMIWFDGEEVSNDLDLEYYDSSYNSFSGSITYYDQTESPRGTESQYSFYGSGNQESVPEGTYYLKVSNNSANDQFFHLYYQDWYRSVYFADPDPDYTIGSSAAADGAIAVGANVSRETWWDIWNNGWPYGYSEGSNAAFSSRGPRVDGARKPSVSAPGSMIISIRDDDYYTWAKRNDSYGGGVYGNFYIDNDGPNQNWSLNDAESGDEARYFAMQGTSMAAPHAAGVAALLLQANPDWTPDQVRHALESTAVDKGTAGHDNIYGWGLIDALNAIDEDSSVPDVFSCNSSGIETNSFTVGQTVYVKGAGLEAGITYSLWIQPGTVTEGQLLVAADDPSSSIETVITSGTGSFGPTAIWDPVTADYGTYDIVVDQHGSGSGTYNAIEDGLDGISAVGFVVPVPETATIILFGLGLLSLGGLLWLRSRKGCQLTTG